MKHKIARYTIAVIYFFVFASISQHMLDNNMPDPYYLKMITGTCGVIIFFLGGPQEMFAKVFPEWAGY
jgi:arginine exporter protein ArgO